MTQQQKTTWIITEGHVGMENPSLGLCEALGLTPVKKRVHISAPWRFLPLGLWGLWMLDKTGDSFQPPWPDFVVSSGRRGAGIALAVKRASGGRTKTIHIQNPFVNPKYFDCVIAPEHDHISGSNVITTRGSIHYITREKLDDAAKKFASQVQSLPHPRIAVLIGGPNKTYDFSDKEMSLLADQLQALSKYNHASFMITTSRRTPEKQITILKEMLVNVPHVLWTGGGDNPYLGFLGLSESIIATSDSINMMTEACGTGKPVYIFELEGKNKRFDEFRHSLYDHHHAKPFTGVLSDWQPVILNEMTKVIKKVKDLIGQR